MVPEQATVKAAKIVRKKRDLTKDFNIYSDLAMDVTQSSAFFVSVYHELVIWAVGYGDTLCGHINIIKTFYFVPITILSHDING